MPNDTEPTSTIRIRFDGIEYVLDPSRISAADTRRVRTETGKSLRWWMERPEDEQDLDVVAVLVWTARRHAGDKDPGTDHPISLSTIENSLSFGNFDDRVEILVGDDEEVDDDPFDDTNDPNS